jgi:hypothetical protein
MSAENNLSSYVDIELAEMREGSKGIGNNALVVYVDKADNQKNPYIIWIKEGQTMDSLTFSSDELSSDPATMSRVLNHVSAYYPADEYGLVLWGHATGWVVEDSIATASSRSMVRIARKAYGVDNGVNSKVAKGKWMNMATLAKTLWEWKHLKFIFADCCQFQCIESAYELRNVTDYIIGSPAEIPALGAPYETVMGALFEASDNFYKTVCDRYFEQVITEYYSDQGGWNTFKYDTQTPLSVIKTAELQNLADATNTVLHSFITTPAPTWTNLQNKRLIYYYGNMYKTDEDMMYDMNDLIRKVCLEAKKDTIAYETWKEVFDRTIIYRKNAKNGWMSMRQIQPYVFRSGILTDERYGGVSMFVPQDRNNTWYYPYVTQNSKNEEVSHDGYNADIKKTAWYAAAHLSDFGW